MMKCLNNFTPKTVEELSSTASLYWSADIAHKVFEENPVQQLINSQDKFLSVLKCADAHPLAWLDVMQTTSLPANIFVKHLMVLSDIGGERFKRFKKDFHTLFPERKFEFAWKGESHTYNFKSRNPQWSNQELRVDKDHLFDTHPFTDSMIDACMLMLWGSNITSPQELPTEILDKCIVGQLIGYPERLEEYVKQRYIHVSRITSGSLCNDAGHICEESCVERLMKNLGANYILDGHHIQGITQNDKNLTTFDIVITNPSTQKSCAIEISFQVTTNSVIERKALLAKDRQNLLHEKGHKVAYVIDGSGNFERRSAVEGIMRFSDCTVNFSDVGIATLAEFIKRSI